MKMTHKLLAAAAIAGALASSSTTANAETGEVTWTSSQQVRFWDYCQPEDYL